MVSFATQKLDYSGLFDYFIICSLHLFFWREKWERRGNIDKDKMIHAVLNHPNNVFLFNHYYNSVFWDIHLAKQS